MEHLFQLNLCIEEYACLYCVTVENVYPSVGCCSSLKAFARENLLLFLLMVMLAQPWLGSDLLLSWFSAVLALVPKPITHSLAHGPFCLC